MWILFGGRTKAQPIQGGREEQRPCEKCGTITRHIECDLTDKVHVFFIDLLSATQRRLVCVRCGDDVEMPEEHATSAKPRGPAKAALPWSPERRALSEKEEDRRLEELKARMRREGKLGM